MSNNPFLGINGSKPVSRDLDQFVEEANRNMFVMDSGKLYFVNERVNTDGTILRFMDRRI